MECHEEIPWIMYSRYSFHMCPLRKIEIKWKRTKEIGSGGGGNRVNDGSVEVETMLDEDVTYNAS